MLLVAAGVACTVAAAVYGFFYKGYSSSTSIPPSVEGCIIDDSLARQKLKIEHTNGLYARWTESEMDENMKKKLKSRLLFVKKILNAPYENADAIANSGLHPATKLALHAMSSEASVGFDKLFKICVCFYYHKIVEENGIVEATEAEKKSAESIMQKMYPTTLETVDEQPEQPS